MELKEFVTNVLSDLDDAVEEARSKSNRDMRLSGTAENRTVEFDIAVTTESSASANGKAGIKVCHIAEAGTGKTKENKDSTVSRIKFGVSIDSLSHAEQCRPQGSKPNKCNPGL
jgi:hypothetical protein